MMTGICPSSSAAYTGRLWLWSMTAIPDFDQLRVCIQLLLLTHTTSHLVEVVPLQHQGPVACYTNIHQRLTCIHCLNQVWSQTLKACGLACCCQRNRRLTRYRYINSTSTLHDRANTRRSCVTACGYPSALSYIASRQSKKQGL